MVAAFGLALVALSPTSLPWLWMVVLGLGVGGIFPLTLTVPLAMTSSVDAARTLTATMLFYGYLLGASGPFVVSLLRSGTGSFLTPFLLLAGLAAAEVLLARHVVGTTGG